MPYASLDERYEANKRWRAKNSEWKKLYDKQWVKENKEKIALSGKKAHQKATYGLTSIGYERLFNAQGRVCAVCKTDDPKHGHGWFTDHDHETGKVRGILCAKCNRMAHYIEQYYLRQETWDSYIKGGK